jgi:hypothetical protein
MIEDLQLAGMSERTQQMYVRAVRQTRRAFQQIARQNHRKSCANIFCTSKNDKVLARPASPSRLRRLSFSENT